MASPNAARRANQLLDQFRAKFVAFEKKNPAVASWLFEVQNGLAQIFGQSPTEAWELGSFLGYMWVLLDTLERLEARGLLPIIGRDSEEQASREWAGSDVRAMVERELSFALNTTSLHDFFEDFEVLLRGVPVPNEGAEAYCRIALAKLFRMRRLSR